VDHIITEEAADMQDTEYLNGSITDVSHGTLKPSCAITPDQGHSLVSKGQPVTPSIAEVDVRHDHVTVPVQYCTVTRVHDSFDKAKIELSAIQDVKLRRNFNEPTLQLPAKFEALDRTADEVRANQLAEISLYYQHHDIDAEKWSHIPKPPFQTSDGHESLTCDDPSGVVHDDVISSTDFIRITSPELKIAPKPPVLGCAYVESTPEVATYVHHHHPGDRIFISAPSIPIWTDANDIAVGGERVEDSYLDSRFGHIIAGGATTMETSEHALVDSGCGKSTIPTGGKFTCNQRDYRSDESRYRIQAAQGDAVAATGIADWVVCWSSDTREGWVLKCMVIKALVIPNSVFYMIATGTEGLGYKGSPLSFVDNANGTGTPAIWQSNIKQYEWLMRKWKVPVIKMIDLPLELKKTIAHRVLVAKEQKGIITLCPPSPTQYDTRMEAEVWAEFNECATGGNLEDCKKAFDRLQLVTQHIESELMQFKNRVGEVDPLLFAHYLIGHRHPQALQKAVKSGEIINCKINLRGAHKFKVKDCLKCTLGSCKEKPCGHRTYSTKHASRQDIADTAVQQHQANEDLSADSRRYLLSATGFKLAQACSPYAVIALDRVGPVPEG